MAGRARNKKLYLKSMSKPKENFLDSKTLVALALIFFAWWAWDAHMKKKYPDRFKKPPTELVKAEKETEKKEKEEKISAPVFLQTEKLEEKELWFKGQKMDILFSSHGLGIKKVLLKNYFDRKKKPIEFVPKNQKLFASFLLNQEIPFNIEKKGDQFIGSFSSDHVQIKKKIEVQEKDFALHVQTEVIPLKEGKTGSLSFSFSHPFPQEKAEGFFKIFFLYGMDMLKTFLIYEGKESKRPQEKDLLFCKNFQNDFCENSFQPSLPDNIPIYKNTELTALGGKYFGKAFINKSSLLPSVQLSREKLFSRAFVKYDFLHSKKQSLEYTIFLGPKTLKNFESLGGNIRQWLDFGFFSWMARPLLLFLIWLYGLCHNWGLAIILLTFVIRLFLLPINIKSYKSMKVMQKIQPELKELRETHKADPKKMNLEVMALMKKHKANPLGGCLPMFIQLPVFFALYRVLGESIELYQSPFILWVQDLSLKDPYFVFPVLAGLVLFVQQSITPMNLPKEQARLIKFLPLIFSVFMLNLPSGLTIYIFVSGLFGLVQQAFFVKLQRPKKSEEEKC